MTIAHPALKLAFQLGKAGGQILDEFDAPTPDELFHYTNTDGLIGMLAGHELWATDARCMNDTDELTLGTSLLARALRSHAAHPAQPLLSRLLSHPTYVSGLVFVTSFTTHSDQLSQWRAYADNGAGFAVGFRAAAFDQLQLDGHDVIKDLLAVEYLPKKLEERAARLIMSILDTLAPHASTAFDDQDDQFLATGLGLVLTTAAASSKNLGFREENEYRIVVRSHQDPLLGAGAKPTLTVPRCHFRSGKYGLTPYLKLRFPDNEFPDALTRIVLGPRVQSPDTEHKVRALLANARIRNWSHFPVERAVATYR